MKNVRKANSKKKNSSPSVKKSGSTKNLRSKSKSKITDQEESVADLQSNNHVSQKPFEASVLLEQDDQATENYEASVLINNIEPLTPQTPHHLQKLENPENKSEQTWKNSESEISSADLKQKEEFNDHEGHFVQQISNADKLTDPDAKGNSQQDLEDADPFGLDNDDDDIDLESVRALTLRDGVDYDDDQQNVFIPEFDPPTKNRNYTNPTYPDGYEDKDDLNQDGVIDHVEKAIKIEAIKYEIKGEINDKIKLDYLKKFREEVDFHHKVAYRFEKSYRLSKKHPAKREALNEEIVDIISEHSNYIEQDPMALFYCLYFCIYYNNPDLVEFMRTLITKIETRQEKMDKLLAMIDNNGIERIRTIGEQINTFVYHMVFYQAVDDDLRIVYAQILRHLKFIQFRDQDAQQFLINRDYDLIRLSFEKNVAKLKMSDFFKNKLSMKSQKYRQYTQAYYEEILIDFGIDPRVAQNYRERFLISTEEIYLVLTMYAKNDYVNYFLRLNLEEISHKQFIELFEIAIKNDAFKVALNIYLRFMTNADMDSRIMEILINSLRDSVKHHEIKLFFIHEHFDVFSIAQLNLLIDTYMSILHTSQFQLNPILSQFNTVKYSLLIYRISWKIEKKKIYSLITKCSVLNTYIIESLISYLSRQQHISQLYKLMREPIFHMTEKKDSLDIMLEMNMNALLQNPVIVEVLNLVYEGKYSVDSKATNLSQTFQCFFLMNTIDMKSINDRLQLNIKTTDNTGNSIQSSLQFNIWKQCIEQREIDEMIFTVIISAIIIFLGLWMDLVISNFVVHMTHLYQEQWITASHIFQNASPHILNDFCPQAKEDLLRVSKIVEYFYNVILVSAIGYITSIVQKVAVVKLNDNAQLQVQELLIQSSITVTSFLLFILHRQNPRNAIVTDSCQGTIEVTQEEKSAMDFVFALISQQSMFNFQLIASILIILYGAIMIMMLQRTQQLGELIMMVGEIVHELKKFMFTFGLIILLFIIIGVQLNQYLKKETATFFKVSQDIFDGLNGQQDFDKYSMPSGTLFITLFVFMFNILLLSFLVAMFINRYKFVFRNLDALRRMNIIKLKNSASFDKIYSSITITFFPISIILLPFIPSVIMFKSERLNDFILKIQYTLMMLMYCVLACILLIPIVPMLYIKSVVNGIYISMMSKRQRYKGQNMAKLIFTVTLNPFLIVFSFANDMVYLPSLLMKDERGFEFKYQQALEILNKIQVETVMNTFTKIFYFNFKQLWGDKVMSLIELMKMHTNIFNIIDNLHDLYCKGNKDYKQALANVQDYNMTKILTRKCSIPDKTGDIKKARCDFNVLYNVQMDIELYNFFEVLMGDYKQGRLTSENLQKERKKFLKQDETNKGAARLNSGVSFLSKDMQPVGVTFKRDNSDVMNNFFVNIVSHSFTNIDEILLNNQEESISKAMKQAVTDFSKVEKIWSNRIQSEVNKQLQGYDDQIQVHNIKEHGNELEIQQKQMDNMTSVNISSQNHPLSDLEDLVHD